MTNRQFQKLVRDFRQQQDKLILKKGYDYTMGNPDRLFNFKWVGETLGIDPLQVLGVYWLKHVLAILTFIKHRKIKSEALAGRFLDEANYNLLGWALAQEQLGQLKKSKRKPWKKKKL